MKLWRNEIKIEEEVSSMLRRSLWLICIKSYNDHNVVQIYQNLPKFGKLGKIVNFSFPVT